MKYDDASWHFSGDYPEDLPEKNAYTHIGMFLAWALLNGLAGELHIEEGAEEIEALKRRDITGADFLQKNCDGKLTDEDLNALGNNFAEWFYENEYFSHYVEVADPEDKYETVYHIPDNSEIYDKVASMLTEQFEKWTLEHR
ncbi:MAG: hypothetical protein GY707_01555 [Desulfobacteraceae bacterium]|nr:hypothetical protein [Desulfobacteraceae bacterium]